MQLRKHIHTVGFAKLRPFVGCLISGVPFSDDTLFGMFNFFITASDDMGAVVMYLTRQSMNSGSIIRYLKSSSCTVTWFNPRTGEYTVAETDMHPVRGEYALPNRPDNQDWLLVLQENGASPSAC